MDLRLKLINRLTLAVLFLLIIPMGISAQASEEAMNSSKNDDLNLYIDCSTCDMNYIKQEVPYVNYMRNVQEAQVYLLVTRQATGSGGQGYTLFYNGFGKFAGMKDTLTYSSSPDDTQDIIRTKLTNTMEAGLMQYVIKTPAVANLEIKYKEQSTLSPKKIEDKWNYWVFSLETRPRLYIDKSRETYSWSNSLKADRITDDWKIQMSFNHSYEKSKYMFYGTTTISLKKSWANKNLIVKSITDHWSAGIRTNVSNSTYDNYDLNINVSPSIEYDIFPYSKSNQKQLRILYGIGYEYHDYIIITEEDSIMSGHYGKETLDIAYQIQQKWGSANLSLGLSNYLHNFRKNRAELDASIRLRVFKGLSLSLSGGIAIIHDQIELPDEETINRDDFILSQKRMASPYEYNASITFTYTFGSMFNNIVNPRFGSGGGFGGGFGGFGFF